jgi:hypothetical protein
MFGQTSDMCFEVMWDGWIRIEVEVTSESGAKVTYEFFVRVSKDGTNELAEQPTGQIF